LPILRWSLGNCVTCSTSSSDTCVSPWLGVSKALLCSGHSSISVLPVQIAAGKTWAIDNSKSNEEHSLVNGVNLGDGDGTVPLVSLGHLCASAWRKPEMNPSGAKVCMHSPHALTAHRFVKHGRMLIHCCARGSSALRQGPSAWEIPCVDHSFGMH
jgi:hypothetical protein